jgi:hypothetical protein
MAAFFPRGNHLRSRRLFSRNWENNHGTEVFEEGIRQSRARNEKAQGRHFEERPFRPEGQEPQASNRDRSFGSESRRKESPEEGYEEKEDRQKAQIKKITEFLIYFAPSLPDAPIGAFEDAPLGAGWESITRRWLGIPGLLALLAPRNDSV